MSFSLINILYIDGEKKKVSGKRFYKSRWSRVSSCGGCL